MSNGKSCWDKIREAFKKEGEFIDWWTIVHTGFGFLMGIILNALGFSIFEGFFIVLILATIWEFIEPTIYKILRKLFPEWDIPEVFPESWTNGLVDIIVALVGFMLAKMLDAFIDSLATGVWAPDWSLHMPDRYAIYKLIALVIGFYLLVALPTRMAIHVRVKRALSEQPPRGNEPTEG